MKFLTQKAKETKQFWSHLPYQFCNVDGVSAGPSQDGNCWNGTTLGNYSATSIEPPDLNTSPILLEQLDTLQLLATNLESAHRGEETSLQYNEEEEITTFSGSGSGDDGFVDLEGGDDDGDGDPERPQSTTRAPEPPPHATRQPPKEGSPGGAANPSCTRAIIHFVLPALLLWSSGAAVGFL